MATSPQAYQPDARATLTREFVRELYGDPEEDARCQRHFRLSLEFERTHRHEIQQRYAGQWVAIYGCTVVHSAADRAELRRLVRADSALDPGGVQVRYIPAQPGRDGR
jgi:hypothetical protein